MTAEAQKLIKEVFDGMVSQIRALEHEVEKMAERAETNAKRCDALTEALRQLDYDCAYCAHANFPAERCRPADFDCMRCDAECACRECRNNGKWEWREPNDEEC